MKFINIRFFDGEEATSGGGAPESVEPQNGPVDPQPDSADGGGTTDGGGEDYSVFDKRSPLLNPGRSEEDELVGTEPEQDAPKDGGTVQTQSQQQQQQPAPPYRVLKYHGQEVPVQSEEELIRLAHQGLDYTRKTQQIAPYRGLIEKLNQNPALMAQVVGLVNGNGVQPQYQQPQPQPQPPQRNTRPAPMQPTSAAEPTPGENETWDEYMARRAAWQAGQGGEQSTAQQQTTQQGQPQDFMGQFNAAMEARERQTAAVRVAQLTMQDPKHIEVLNVIASEVPQSLQAAMNQDPVSYQMVYDQVRRNITGEPYFAGLGRARAPQPQQQAIPQPTQPTILKSGSKPAPVVESGRGQTRPGTQPVRGVNGLPNDIWGMDDAAFTRLMESSMNQR